jgi:heme-degrading monooxygenase HmoA
VSSHNGDRHGWERHGNQAPGVGEALIVQTGFVTSRSDRAREAERGAPTRCRRVGQTVPAWTRAMISRIWHGHTQPGQADAFEALLREVIFAGTEARSIAGFREIQLFRRALGDEVEFVTVMWFDTMEAIRDFAGDDTDAAVVPHAARQLLSRFDERCRHYEVREQRRQ